MALARLIAGGLLPSVHSLRRGDEQSRVRQGAGEQGRVDQGVGLRVERRATRIGVRGYERNDHRAMAAQASVDCSRRQAYCLR